MQHWLETHPHSVFASVLLVDNNEEAEREKGGLLTITLKKETPLRTRQWLGIAKYTTINKLL